MTGTDVAIIELSKEAERALIFWRNNPMLPASYIKAGIVQWDDMRRAAWLLTWLDLDVAASLGDTFVVKDTVGLKADLQRTLLGRVPGYAMDFPEIADDHVTGRIHTPNGGWSSPLTKRLTRVFPIPNGDIDRGWRGDRDMVTYAKGNEKNYGDKPNRMLLARTTTLLIDIYAKGIIRGLVRAQAGDAAAIYTDQSDELEPPPALELPARATAPDGSTIPEPLREPAVDDDVRAQLAYRIEALQPDARADLATVCKNLKLPNLRTNRFTRAHGALLGRLIAEVVDRHGTGEIVQRLDTLIGQIVDDQRPVVVEMVDDVVPHYVYDDAPESSDSEVGAERYDPDDAGRPFA